MMSASLPPWRKLYNRYHVTYVIAHSLFRKLLILSWFLQIDLLTKLLTILLLLILLFLLLLLLILYTLLLRSESVLNSTLLTRNHFGIFFYYINSKTTYYLRKVQ